MWNFGLATQSQLQRAATTTLACWPLLLFRRSHCAEIRSLLMFFFLLCSFLRLKCVSVGTKPFRAPSLSRLSLCQTLHCRASHRCSLSLRLFALCHSFVATHSLAFNEQHTNNNNHYRTAPCIHTFTQV